MTLMDRQYVSELITGINKIKFSIRKFIISLILCNTLSSILSSTQPFCVLQSFALIHDNTDLTSLITYCEHI